MPESKIRVKHTRPFTIVSNSVLRDERISLKTLGLFVVMQSFPEDWEYSISGLAARCRIGRDAIRACLKELEDAGYLLKEQRHQEDGKFSCNTYVLQAEAPPCTEKPSTVSPYTVKPLTVNPTQVNKHLSNPLIVPPKGGRRARKPKTMADWLPERFESFWAWYRVNVCPADRQAAIRAWDKLQPDEALIARIGRALQKQVASELWASGKGRPYASTYLNNARWEDAEGLPEPAAQEARTGGGYGWE